MLKLIYLAKRHPSLSPDEFTRRWRLHGARGMSTSIWRNTVGYVQAELIRPVTVSNASDEHDGVALMMVKDDTFTAPPVLPDDAEAAQMLVNDEKETFAAAITSVSMWGEEEFFKIGPLGGTTAFLFFTDERKARQVARVYSCDVRLHRVTFNVKREGPELGAMRSTLPYDAVVEVSALDILDLESALEAAAGATYRDAHLTVVTREAVLWDRLA